MTCTCVSCFGVWQTHQQQKPLYAIPCSTVELCKDWLLFRAWTSSPYTHRINIDTLLQVYTTSCLYWVLGLVNKGCIHRCCWSTDAIMPYNKTIHTGRDFLGSRPMEAPTERKCRGGFHSNFHDNVKATREQLPKPLGKSKILQASGELLHWKRCGEAPTSWRKWTLPIDTPSLQTRFVVRLRKWDISIFFM